MNTYLVVWTRSSNGRISDNDTSDHYSAFDTIEQARIFYSSIVALSSTAVASITIVVESTDYV
jgi:hypothetical protein